MELQIVEKFVKYDQDKPRMDLVPPLSTVAMAKVLAFGAKKYSPNNWRKCESRTKYMAACLRHIFTWLSGETTDPESGLPHLAHALCCLHFVLEMELEGLGKDDRVNVVETKTALPKEG